MLLNKKVVSIFTDQVYIYMFFYVWIVHNSFKWGLQINLYNSDHPSWLIEKDFKNGLGLRTLIR